MFNPDRRAEQSANNLSKTSHGKPGSVEYHRSFRADRTTDTMKTFAITTLGCRVNHYEGEQLAALLRQRGLTEAPPDRADLRIVHTCSVTTQAASKSRQAARRATRLTVLGTGESAQPSAGGTNPEIA